MTPDDKHNDDLDKSLLDDNDFTALIDAEYRAQSSQDDQLRKQRIWSALKPRLSETRNKSPRLKITAFALAALLLVMLIPAVLLDRPEPLERIKGLPPTSTSKLSAFEFDATGKLISSTGTHLVGSTIVFKVNTDQAVSAALLFSRNNGDPEIRFTGDIMLGEAAHLLQDDKHAYGYMIEPHDQQLRFCIATANDAANLQKKLQHVESVWSALPPSSCVDLLVSQ